MVLFSDKIDLSSKRLSQKKVVTKSFSLDSPNQPENSFSQFIYSGFQKKILTKGLLEQNCHIQPVLQGAPFQIFRLFPFWFHFLLKVFLVSLYTLDTNLSLLWLRFDGKNLQTFNCSIEAKTDPKVCKKKMCHKTLQK